METHEEFVQDVMLAIAFSLLALVAGYRSYRYFTLQGSGKVVTLFYILIFITSFVRAIWFGIPSDYLEGSYVPKATVAFHSSYWEGVLISELLLAIGTISLYAVFILLISFWANMLHKVEQNDNSPQNLYEHERKPRGPLETFSLVIIALLIMEAINIVLFLCRVYNSEVMILYDSALFSVISLTCLYGITFFSSRIRIILQTLGYINARSTKHQVQRILAMTLAANVFFLLRVSIEVCIGITLVLHFLASRSFFFVKSDSLWSKIILAKHMLEVLILGLELVVSTSVSSRGQRRSTQQNSSLSQTVRRNNQPRRKSSKDGFLPMTPEAAAQLTENSNTEKATERTPLIKKKIVTSKYSL